MPAVAPTGPTQAGKEDGGLLMWTWVLTTANPIGQGVKVDGRFDCNWHAKGTIGGATVTVEAAPTDTDADYAPCKSAAGGAAIGLTSLPAVASNIENSIYIRPRLNPAGATANLTVTLVASKNQTLRT